MAPALTISETLPQETTSIKNIPSAQTFVTATSVSPSPSPNLPAAANGFQHLIAEINRILGPTSGLTTEGVDLEALTHLMENYESNEADWAPYAFSDLSRGYTRNLVDVGNGKANLLILCWSPGKGSMIHDHADAHCLMRILKGSLVENRYKLAPGFTKENPIPPIKIMETRYNAGQVTYMSDELGMHKIQNAVESLGVGGPDGMPEVAVSLHLYTPPNAAREGCNVFCERTGRKSHVEQNNYYSVMGVRS